MGERRYWDSDCFLGFLKSEDGKAAMCRQVLEKAETGNIQIITSVLTIAEVLDLRGNKKIEKDQRAKIIAFFKKSFIVPVSVTRRLAEHSRELVWDYGIKPKDALHVATAIHARTTLLNTFDQGLISKSGNIGNPAIIVERPQLDQMELSV